MIPVNRPLIDEKDLDFVTTTLRETYISGDTPIIGQLEAKISETVGTKFAVAVNSGTSALDLVSEALGLDQNSEVIAPTFTIISTVSHLVRRKAKLLLIDADEKTWSMNSEVTADKVSNKTSAIFPVHIYGLPVDLNEIISASEKFDVPIIEDAAEALGLYYNGRHCGSFGKASIFSFFANKIVTGGEGGAICTSDVEFASKLRSLRNLCHSPDERFVHNEIGYNFRMPGLPAALIYSQLFRLPSLIDHKIAIADRYHTNLQGHPWLNFHPKTTSFAKNIYWVFGILLNENCPFDAKNLQKELQKRGVDTRRFFCPIHLQPAAKESVVNPNDNFPVSEKLWNRGLYLPSGLGNTESEIDTVSEVLWEMAK